MADTLFGNMSPGLDSPYIGALTITPSNSTVLSQTTRAIYVGGTGNLALTFADGTTAILESIPVGTLLPVRATQVLSTGTTATKLIGLY